MSEPMTAEEFRAFYTPTYTPTIQDGAVLRWRGIPGLEVNASRNGVGISGSVVLRFGEDVGRLKALLDEATNAHREIERRGHEARCVRAARMESL